MEFTLWNTHVNSISESGVYKLQCLKVNSSNGKYFTITTATAIKQSRRDIFLLKTIFMKEDEGKVLLKMP